MKFILLLLFGVYGTFYQQTETVDIKILVTNINTHKGNIELGIFNKPKNFLHEGSAYKSYSKKARNDSIVFFLKDFPKGDYAVSIYHDVNTDKECNLNFLGIPVEPYGFSKNYKPRFSKPSFEDCKISAENNTSIEIKLID